jgi:hypothetical protein
MLISWPEHGIKPTSLVQMIALVGFSKETDKMALTTLTFPVPELYRTLHFSVACRFPYLGFPPPPPASANSPFLTQSEANSHETQSSSELGHHITHVSNPRNP